MSRSFAFTYISLNSFLSDWEEINQGLVDLAAHSFRTTSFALTTRGDLYCDDAGARERAPPNATPTSALHNAAPPLEITATGVYELVYRLLAGCGPVRGDVDPCTDKAILTGRSSPVSPHTNGESAAKSSGRSHSNSSSNSGRGGENGSDAAGAETSPARDQRKPLGAPPHQRCVYNRMELLLPLAHLSMWLWLALVSCATGGRLRLPAAVYTCLTHAMAAEGGDDGSLSSLHPSFAAAAAAAAESSEEAELPPPLQGATEAGERLRSAFHFELDSAVDRARWQHCLRRTIRAWLGAGMDNVAECFVAPRECGSAEEVEALAPETVHPAMGGGQPTGLVMTIEQMLSLHALVTLARHFQAFSRLVSTAFLRLSLALESAEPGGTRHRRGGGERHVGRLSVAADHHVLPCAPHDGVATVLHEAVREVLLRNAPWVQQVIACTARAKLGGQELTLSSPLTPTLSGGPPAGRSDREGEMDSTDARGCRSTRAAPLDWLEVAAHVERDLPNVHLIHAMTEQSGATALHDWTVTVVEENCFARGRRLLNSTLLPAMSVVTHVRDEDYPVDTGEVLGDGEGEEMEVAERSPRCEHPPAAEKAEEAALPQRVGGGSTTATTAVDAQPRQPHAERKAFDHNLSLVARQMLEDVAEYDELCIARAAASLPPPPLPARVGARLGTANVALREALRAYVELRAALLLFSGGTAHYMDALTPGGRQRFICGIRAFTRGWCSPHSTAPATPASAPLAPALCDVRQFMLVYGVPLWIQLCAKTQRRQADPRAGGAAVGPAGPPSLSLSQRQLHKAVLRDGGRAEPSEEDDGEWAREEDDGDPGTATPPSSRAPTVAPRGAAAVAATGTSAAPVSSVGRGSSAAGADTHSLADALSEATSAMAAEAGQLRLRRALGLGGDEGVEERELRRMAALPEDGLPTLLSLLTHEEAGRRAILSTFSAQVHRYMVLLLARGGDSDCASTAPLPSSVFEKCVLALHMTHSAFSRADSSEPGGATGADSSPALSTLAEIAAEAVVNGLQAFFAEYERRVAPTLANALHAQVLEDVAARRGERTAVELAAGTRATTATMTGPRGHTATLQVVDTLLSLASILPSREGFVRDYKALIAPRLLRVRTAADLDVDTEVLSRMTLRLGAEVVHPCLTLLRDLRLSLASTRGQEPHVATEANGGEGREEDVLSGPGGRRRRRRRRRRASHSHGDRSGDVHGGGDQHLLHGRDSQPLPSPQPSRTEASPRERSPLREREGLAGGGLLGQGRGTFVDGAAAAASASAGVSANMTPASEPLSLATAARVAATLLPMSLTTTSPTLGPARSPVAYAMSLLSGSAPSLRAGGHVGAGDLGHSHSPPYSLPGYTPPRFLRQSRVLCQAWWAPHVGTPLLSSHRMRHLYETHGFLGDQLVDAVLRLEWYYCGPPEEWGEAQPSRESAGEPPHTPGQAVGRSRFPGYGRYRHRPSAPAHGRTASYDSTVTDGGSGRPGLFSAAHAARPLQGLGSALSKTVQQGASVVGGLRRTEHRSGAFGNDEPDEDEDYLAAYGGVLEPRRVASVSLGRTGGSGDEYGSASSIGGRHASRDDGNGSTSTLGGGVEVGQGGGSASAPAHALERRRLHWPMACGQLVFLVHPRGGGGGVSYQVTGPPIVLVLLQLLDRRGEAGASLAWLCDHMPVKPTPRPIIAAILKTAMAGGLVHRRRDEGLGWQLYWIPDTFDTATEPLARSPRGRRARKEAARADPGKGKRKIVVDLTAVLQMLPAQAGWAVSAAHSAPSRDGSAPGDHRRDSGPPPSPSGSVPAAPQAFAVKAPAGGVPPASTAHAPSRDEEARWHILVMESMIVGLLKRAGSMPHTALAEAVAAQMRDVYTQTLFKQAMGRLVERDYVRRNEEERSYVYVP